MRKYTLIASAVALAALTVPAFAAGRGNAGGARATGAQTASMAQAGGMGHGLGTSVRQAAMTARQAGTPVGSSVRAAARVNAQGPVNANANAITHVQNSTGQANANSVLGTGVAPPTDSGAAVAAGTMTAADATTASAAIGTTGDSARTNARTNAQGAEYANPNAISHVQDSPGRANDNSVLGNTDTTTEDGSGGE